MTEPKWLTTPILLAIHADQIRDHGGALGIRDEGLLESALERARNAHHYDGTKDWAELAAYYGFGLAKNHPFVDGNKRVAFQAMAVFLSVNGLQFTASEEDVVRSILSLAAGDLDQPSLAAWIRSNMKPL